MKHLQATTHSIVESQTPEQKLELLGKAFEIFSTETTRLETAYLQLSEQFRMLNLQLAETNQKLEHKVGELHLITNYLNCVLDNMAQGILFIDLDGTVATYNKAAETILGVPFQQVLAHKFWHSFPDTLFGFSVQSTLAAKQTPATSCTSYFHPDNSLRELELVATLVLNEGVDTEEPVQADADPEPRQGIIIMVRDITDKRRLQLLTNRDDRMKALGEMAAQVAHEIRNPLGGIKGFASLLRRDLTDRPQQQKMAEQIIDGTDALNELVNQVLDYARPPHPHFKMTAVQKLFKEVDQLIRADEAFTKQQVGLQLETPKDDVLIDMDYQLLKSALLNLVVNAIQAMPHGGTITLGLQHKHDTAIITVADTGEGISPENLEKVFSPFFTTKPNGNGFGLAEVHKTVQAHQGTVDVKSHPGKGTTFTIRLPVKRIKDQYSAF